jgi:hypothetical protein
MLKCYWAARKAKSALYRLYQWAELSGAELFSRSAVESSKSRVFEPKIALTRKRRNAVLSVGAQSRTWSPSSLPPARAVAAQLGAQKGERDTSEGRSNAQRRDQRRRPPDDSTASAARSSGPETSPQSLGPTSPSILLDSERPSLLRILLNVRGSRECRSLISDSFLSSLRAAKCKLVLRSLGPLRFSLCFSLLLSLRFSLFCPRSCALSYTSPRIFAYFPIFSRILAYSRVFHVP